MSHIGEKVFKFHPSFADGYSASTVVLPVAEFLITTSSPHILPSSVFWRSLEILGDSMSRQNIAVKTTATTCRSMQEASNMDDFGFPTLALAKPMVMTVADFGNTKSSEPTEYLTRDIEMFWH